MARIVRVDLNPTGFTYDVYSGTSVTGITDLVCSGVTVFCQFDISNSVSGSYIYIKLISKDCKDQILEVYIGPPDCSFGVSIQEVTVVKVWRPDPLCETDDIFAIRKMYTGLCSPGFSKYDPVTKRVYVVDYDNYLHPTQWGNVYWFDPVTATSRNDFTYYHGNSLTDGSQLRYNSLRNAYIDLVYRRIYIAGTNLDQNGNPITTGLSNVNGVPLGPITGLVVYDMDTNTHQTVLNYGSFVVYERDFIYVNDLYIYLNDFRTRFIRINRSDFSNITYIPFSGSSLTRQRYLEQNPQILQVSNNRLWLVSTGSGRQSGPAIPTTRNIGVFDFDFNFLGEIILPNVQTFNSRWGNCCYYRQSIFKDPITNRIYVADLGSSQRFVIQPDATYSSGSTIIFSESMSGITENRVYAGAAWEIDPVNNNIYQNMVLLNWENPASTANYKSKVYLINRNDYSYIKLFDNNNFRGLTLVNDGLSNSLVGVNPGVLYLNNISTYNVDGQITFYNNTIQGQNTGNVIVNQLIEYDPVTNLPTGNVKPNNPSDPDYIPSPYFDTNPISGCPIVYTTNCPIVLSGTSGNIINYELGFSTPTILNPIISAISVTYIYNTSNIIGGTNTHLTPFTSNYVYGSFNNYNNLSGTARIVVQLISTTNTILNTCTYT